MRNVAAMCAMNAAIAANNIMLQQNLARAARLRREEEERKRKERNKTEEELEDERDREPCW